MATQTLLTEKEPNIFTYFCIQVNTFQAVLATDGNATYVMFLYRDIQWGDGETGVGFNAGDGIRGFNLPETNTTEGILNLAKRSNVCPDYPGVYFFRVDQSDITQPLGSHSINSTPACYYVSSFSEISEAKPCFLPYLVSVGDHLLSFGICDKDVILSQQQKLYEARAPTAFPLYGTQKDGVIVSSNNSVAM